MKFPLARSPGTIVMVDDSATLLPSLVWRMPEPWCVKTFSDQDEMMTWMRSKVEYRKNMVDELGRWASFSKGARSPLVEVVRFWNAFLGRYELPTVLVVDYHMPKGNGLALLDKCQGYHGGRLMLSAVVDEKTATVALNEGKIDRYVGKASNAMKDLLLPSIRGLFNKAALHDNLSWSPWLASLSIEQLMLLQSEDVANKLLEYVGELGEYVTLGHPFGIVSLPSGVPELNWLQLETKDSLSESAAFAKEHGATSDEVHAIAHGKAISNAQAIAELCPGGKITVKPVQWQVDLPVLNTSVMAAEFAIQAPMVPYPESRYAGWRSRQPANQPDDADD